MAMSCVTSTSVMLLLLVELHNEIQNELRIHAVEVARGFVRNEHGRAIGKASSYGDTLPLTAGELGGKMVEAMFQPDSLEQLDGAIPSFPIEADSFQTSESARFRPR